MWGEAEGEGGARALEPAGRGRLGFCLSSLFILSVGRGRVRTLPGKPLLDAAIVLSSEHKSHSTHQKPEVRTKAKWPQGLKERGEPLGSSVLLSEIS